ncbi:GNAT family N-acetyltransferase [Arachidicoccus ginsenosidivorans]|uniref:GNAT family N-acetyltransferase n=1 Tax=Arachidicoccus ginsenosidivorans TaxID=496057 RepID=A0A5B8VQ27_9BACT|nr:GNAT family N-acetyltransferase [Arachidicoccus ginsenosidivorans]QEC73211.1 GNAT family N-acetyltransferase [Arachidicoccus ginsenosidivorans]
MNYTTQCKKFEELSLIELYRILQLRNQVFYVEQHCDDLDLDDKDQQSLHLTIYDGDVLAGYARLLPPGLSYQEMSIGRVAVSASYRGRGLGRLMMEKSLEHLELSFGKGPIKISAQRYLEQFYGSLGFKTISEVYLEAGIEHIKMFRA